MTVTASSFSLLIFAKMKITESTISALSDRGHNDALESWPWVLALTQSFVTWFAGSYCSNWRLRRPRRRSRSFHSREASCERLLPSHLGERWTGERVNAKHVIRSSLFFRSGCRALLQQKGRRFSDRPTGTKQPAVAHLFETFLLRSMDTVSAVAEGVPKNISTVPFPVPSVAAKVITGQVKSSHETERQ